MSIFEENGAFNMTIMQTARAQVSFKSIGAGFSAVI